MKISDRQRHLLVGILADIEAAVAAPCPIDQPRNGWDLELIRQWERERSGVVRSDPSRWLGRGLSNSDYVLLSRDWKRLEAAGLIERHCLGFEHIAHTHVSLTDAGLELVKQLSAKAIDA